MVDVEAVDRDGGAMAAVTLFIGKLVIVGMKIVEYNEVCREMRDWLGAGDSRSWEDAVLGVCCTWCMLYPVYAVLGVCCTQC